MQKYLGYLIDLDGTMYRGNEEIDGAKEFIEKLYQENTPYVFVTNNSTKTAEDVAKYLQDMQIRASASQIITSSKAIAGYIQSKHSGRKVTCYCIGEEGLKRALNEIGVELTNDINSDYVIVGLDRSITYKKLEGACLAIRNGATFLSTNRDHAIPTEKGMGPGNGAITALISTSTEVEPLFVGKPDSIIMQQALKSIGMSSEQVIMIGDNYHTDIQAGICANMDTLHVETGVTTKEQLLTFSDQPTYTVKTLKEWIPYI
ncbi:TIGR01457 family HAD-type hydrolase [Oceanobacillus kimchii]|uniref:TIGR01457 family HAD-type hydrolase n=1 Tax=Oceanobacillus kimchii TaxID=746691 RepID=UPI0009873772|nr:TIGR01457 family HAD-type hydrolase [Oceanobacillus kimchii]